MKVNAPEKVYLSKDLFRWSFGKASDKSDIEYTRTEAFIEKVAIWFNNNFIVHDEYGVISDSFDTKEGMFDDFKNYMEK